MSGAAHRVQVGAELRRAREQAASTWLGSGADPKVVQRVLGHASTAMTMDLYGHLIDRNLWGPPGGSGAPQGHPRTKGRTMNGTRWSDTACG
jgi:hypothetical protein